MKKIGIPRAFYYYHYPKLWETFFGKLNFEVVVSDSTSSFMMEQAYRFSETEHCLAHKLFDAHLCSLIGKTDYIFIPRLLSMTKHHVCCAKFGALPDASKCVMASASRFLKIDDNKKSVLLSIDINESKMPLKKTLFGFALQLGSDKKTARNAVGEAYDAMLCEIECQREKMGTPSEGRRFLVTGHPYIIYEPYIISPILKKITAMGHIAEPVSFEALRLPFKGGFMPFGRLFSFEMPSPIRWCTFSKIYQKILALDKARYAGIIHISTYNCGPDSIMTELYRNLCRKLSIPCLILMLDEHTASAGIETRLEAFADSLEWGLQNG